MRLARFCICSGDSKLGGDFCCAEEVGQIFVSLGFEEMVHEAGDCLFGGLFNNVIVRGNSIDQNITSRLRVWRY